MRLLFHLVSQPDRLSVSPQFILAAKYQLSDSIEPGHQPGASPLTAQSKALLLRCRDVYVEFLDRLTVESFSAAVRALMAQEGATDSPTLRQSVVEARVKFSEQGNAIAHALVVEASQRPLEPLRDANFDAAASDAGSQLRLLDAAELERELLVNGLKIRVLRELRRDVEPVQARLATLFASEIDNRNDPFGLSHALDRLGNQVANVGVAPIGERVFFEVLEPVALARARELNSKLIGILGAITPTERSLPADEKPNESHENSEEETSAENSLSALASIVSQLFPTNEKTTADNTVAPNNLTLQRIRPTALATAARMRRIGATGGSRARYSEVERIARQEAWNRTLSDAELAPLFGAIEELNGGGEEAFDVSRINDVDQKLATELGSGIANSQAVAHGRVVLDDALRALAMANSQLMNGTAIKRLLASLEKTLLKLALLDQGFPAEPTHPARRVVELIDQFEVGLDERGEISDAKTRVKLGSTIAMLREQGASDPRAFAAAYENLEPDLEHLLRERKQRVAQTREALEVRDRMRQARAAADRALRSALAARKIPEALIRFLGECLRERPQFTHLRHGESSPEYETAVAELRELAAVSVEDIDVDATAELRSKLMSTATRYLRESALSPETQTRVLGELSSILIERDVSALRNRTLAPAFDEEREQLSSSVASAWRDSIGAWWDMAVSGVTNAVQLIWVSDNGEYLGFVNRSAQKRTELKVSDFEGMLRKQSAVSRSALDTPLFDRVETVVLEASYDENVRELSLDQHSGLPSRKAIQRELVDFGRSAIGSSTVALALIEFDQFREVSASAGIDAVEELAKQLANATKAALPAGTLVGQFREDTLIVLIRDYAREAAIRIMTGLQKKLADFRFQHREFTFSIGSSVGIDFFTAGDCSETEMIRRVDAACVAARALGRNSLQAYAPSDAELRAQIGVTDWAGRIDSIFQSESLYLRAQMIAPIPPNQRRPYFEILVGIERAGDTPVSTFEFVRALERLGRAHELDLWVVTEAFRWIRANRQSLDQMGGFSINLSGASISRSEVLARVKEELARSSLPAHWITFEITESVAIKSFELAQNFVRELRNHGAKVAIDDFGSGYTSYAHLKKLSVDVLKIDGSYVKEILTNESDSAIVKSMTDIAHTLGMDVVAEWAESNEILLKLAELNVDYAQGYAVHKPVRLSNLLQ